MAAITKRSDKWQIRVRHRLLPKPFFATFDEEDEARSYASRLEAMLDRGVVPMDLMEQGEKRGSDPVLFKMLESYVADGGIAPTDAPVVEQLKVSLPRVRLSGVTARWADDWVADMKLVENLAPSTIRKRVESLARAIDWYWRRTKDGQPPGNALRLMPRGYSQYTEAETLKVTAAGGVAKRDVERNRRLAVGEEDAIRKALAGEKRPGRERALDVDPDFSLLFDLIVHTGLRLKEAYTLRSDQIDTTRRVIRVDGSKGERGRIKPRVVPLVKDLRGLLDERCKLRTGLIFGFWSGDADDMKRCSSRLSNRFSTLFDYAGVDDFKEHDLRHEATCRWVTMRGPDGRWLFSEVEICKIMGWSDPKMMLRYASLRGEDLSDRLS